MIEHKYQYAILFLSVRTFVISFYTVPFPISGTENFVIPFYTIPFLVPEP